MIKQENGCGGEDGPQIQLIMMESARVRVNISTLGATIQSVQLLRAANQKWTEVTCGYDSPCEYLDGHHYFGATVGRFANRIANGAFRLNGKEVSLTSNNNAHCLHGGVEGFHRKLWDIVKVSGIATDENPEEGEKDHASVTLMYRSPDGEEGFPCDLRVLATFTLSKTHHTLTVRYESTNEDPLRWTVVNLVSHPYWNLEGFGEGGGDVLGHTMRIDAPWYLPTDDTAVPTGEIHSVKGTPFDFVGGKTFQEAVSLLESTPHRGIDHTFVLRTPHDSDGFRRARLELVSPTGWVTMRSATNNPGIQIYTGNYMSCRATLLGHGGVQYKKHGAVCLEAQFFPDSPNNRHFPSTVLKAKETLAQWQSFQFVFNDNIQAYS